MNAAQSYSRAGLLCTDEPTATVCAQFSVLTAQLDAPCPLPIHRILAEKAPTPQSCDMHRALAMVLVKVTDAPDNTLSAAHVLCWAQLTRHFVVAGVRTAAAQFAIETEELCKALAQAHILADYENRIFVLQQELRASAAHAQAKIAALRACVTYAREKRSKDFDYDTWENLCEHAMNKGVHAPNSLELEIALHAQTRDALTTVQKKRDALRNALSRFSLECASVSHREHEFHKANEPCPVVAALRVLL